MNIGLQTYNTDGRKTLTPRSKTIRVVARRTVWYGLLEAGAVVRVEMPPEVKAGMFAQATALDSSNGDLSDYAECMPALQVYDGYALIIAPGIYGCVSTGNLTIYVFETA
jgi:hypothetical protein